MLKHTIWLCSTVLCMTFSTIAKANHVSDSSKKEIRLMKKESGKSDRTLVKKSRSQTQAVQYPIAGSVSFDAGCTVKGPMIIEFFDRRGKNVYTWAQVIRPAHHNKTRPYHVSVPDINQIHVYKITTDQGVRGGYVTHRALVD